MRILFVLPGLHRVARGAEVAFESVADALARGGDEVALMGSGEVLPDRAYRFVHVPAVAREHFERYPSLPLFRNEYAYEEATFAAGLAFVYRRDTADVTVGCSYPFTNWVLRSHWPFQRRPAHVFVTENGDWPATNEQAEYRFFSCDGLICTNPLMYEQNRERWRCALIPNGVEPRRFHPGNGRRGAFGLPSDRPVVLIASALVEVKRIEAGIRAVARLPDVYLLVAGEGPLRARVEALGEALLPGRFARRAFPAEAMPDLYRSVDVLLHPARAESFGNVYVEALCSGLPVVANDTARTRWILGPHGVLVDALSEGALAAGVEQALAQAGDDGEVRYRFAAERYGWDVVAAKYRAFFQEVLAAMATETRGAVSS